MTESYQELGLSSGPPGHVIRLRFVGYVKSMITDD